MARARRFENELYNLSRIEIPANELGVGFVFFERHDGQMGGLHDRMAYRRYAFKEVEGVGFGGAGEGLDEDNLG